MGVYGECARLLEFLSRQRSWCGDSEMSPCKNTSKSGTSSASGSLGRETQNTD